jgi:ribosomal protein S12 methylthiotransferase accessory factor YcaO
MVNVPLNDSVAAALSAQAAARGMTLQAYLETLAMSVPVVAAPRLTSDELDQLLDQEATATGNSPGGTFSREELYRDHD